MKPSLIFVYLVFTLILTTIIFVFINNMDTITIPTLNNQIKQYGDRKLLIALGISIVIVLFFIVFANSIGDVLLCFAKIIATLQHCY